MRRPAAQLFVVGALLLAAAGCAPPGTPVEKIQAAKLGVATNDISTACGYAWELTAFGGSHPNGLASQESTAVSAAHKLAGVYAQTPSDLYEGESASASVRRRQREPQPVLPLRETRSWARPWVGPRARRARPLRS